MKKAILYRLLSKDADGNFITNGQKQELRNDVSVTQEYIDEQNAQMWQSGLYYEVNEEATAELERINRVLAGLEEDVVDDKPKRGRKASNNTEEEEF